MNIVNELKRTIEHPHYQRAVKDCHARMTFMPEGSVLGLVGPTRVGKSRAIREALQMVYPRPSSKKQFSYFEIDASTTDMGFISTRYLTLTMLSRLEHPFYTGDEHGLRINNTETVARIRLIRALEHRETKMILIDEAHHLLRTKSTRSSLAALDSLKCLGNETGVKIVLTGSYELLSACFSSAHLNGRLSVVEFPRYRPDARDMVYFDRLLGSLDPILPWAAGESLMKHRRLMHEGTLGCYGLLESWILSALSAMTSAGTKRLTREHFVSTRFRQQLEPIADEIALGEGMLKTIVEPRTAPSSEGNPPARRRKPGRRTPHRDPVQ